MSMLRGERSKFLLGGFSFIALFGSEGPSVPWSCATRPRKRPKNHGFYCFFFFYHGKLEKKGSPRYVAPEGLAASEPPGRRGCGHAVGATLKDERLHPLNGSLKWSMRWLSKGHEGLGRVKLLGGVTFLYMNISYYTILYYTILYFILFYFILFCYIYMLFYYSILYYIEIFMAPRRSTCLEVHQPFAAPLPLVCRGLHPHRPGAGCGEPLGGSALGSL